MVCWSVQVLLIHILFERIRFDKPAGLGPMFVTVTHRRLGLQDLDSACRWRRASNIMYLPLRIYIELRKFQIGLWRPFFPRTPALCA